MTWVAVGVAVVGTAYSAYSSNQAAKAQAGQARSAGWSAANEGAMNQMMNTIQAEDITLAARQEADNIKRQAMMVRGQMAVAQSASGVVMGEGSAQAAFDQLDTLSSADALAALYSAVNKSANVRAGGRYEAQAGMEKAKAFGESAASYESAANSAIVGGLLTAGSQLAGGYVKSQPPKKG